MQSNIGTVRAINGKFWIQDQQGHKHLLKIGEKIKDGDLVIADSKNGKQAQLIVDILEEGAGDMILTGDARLIFDQSMLARVFSHHDAIVSVTSLKDALKLAQIDGDKTEEVISKNDETASGEEKVNQSDNADAIFAQRDNLFGNTSSSAISLNNIATLDGNITAIFRPTLFDTNEFIITPTDTTGNITIVGTATQGQTLGVLITDTDGVNNPVYLWTANGVVVSTNDTLTLTQDYVDQTISVTATYTDPFGTHTVTDTIDAKNNGTTTVTNIDDTGSVTILGVAQEDEILTTSLVDIDGIIGAPTYTWLVDGIAAANTNMDQSTFTLTQAHVGKEVSVSVIYSDRFGSHTVTDSLDVANNGSTTVTNVNDAPDAIDDSGLTTNENTSLTMTAATLLTNDIDVDNDTLTITSVQNAQHGTVVLDGIGNVVFTPDAGYHGNASFTYTISDGHGESDTATVRLTVLDNIAPLSDPAHLGITLVVDDQGTVTGNLADGAATDDAKPELSGIAEALSTVSILDNGVKIGETTADASSNWNFIPLTPLLVGIHTFTITATDWAGNTSAPSAPHTINFIGADAPAAPAIIDALDNIGSITGIIAKDTGVTDDTNPEIRGTAQALSTVKLYDGATLVGQTTADSSGNWNITTSNLSDGIHTITATATNAAGNTSPSTGAYTFKVDTLAPNIVGTNGTTLELYDDVSPIVGNITTGMITNDATPTIRGTGEAGTTITAYDDATTLGTSIVAADGSWSINLALPLNNGNHSMTVTATDVAGNTSISSTPINFTVDTSSVTTPTITNFTDNVNPLTGVFASGTSTNDITPTFSGTAQNNTTVQLYIDNVATGTPFNVTAGIWNIEALLLSQGAHSVAAVATNAAGTTSFSSPFNIILDTQAPGDIDASGTPVITEITDDVGSIQGKVVQGASTDDTTPTIQGTAEALSTIKIYDGSNLLGETTVNASGTWTYTITSPLGNAMHGFHAIATDAAGNVSVDSNIYSVVIDTIAPLSDPAHLAITSVIDDQGAVTGNLINGAATDDAKPALNGIAEANSTVTIIDNGVKIGETITTPSGTWAFTPITPLLTGIHTFTITATDMAGNTSAPSASHTINFIGADAPAAPAIISAHDNISPIEGIIAKDTGVTNDKNPEFRGTAQAGATVKLYDGLTLVGQTITDSDGNWSITTSTLGEGNHSITATATNAAGNTSPSTGVFVFNVDTLAPKAPTINTIESDDIINLVEKSDGVTISGTAQAGATVKLYDNNNYLTEIIADDTGIWNISFSSSQVPVDGIREVKVTATDTAGNVSTSTIKLVTIETVAPTTPTINIIEGNDIINAAEKADGVIISGIAEALSSVTLMYNNTVIATLTTDVTGNWSAAFDTTQVPADGSATVTATATDASGNISTTASKTVLIDTTPPTIPTLFANDDIEGVTGTILNNTITNDDSPTLLGNGENGSTIIVYDGNSPIGQTTVVNGVWTITLTDPLSNATHSLKAVATDVAGNTSESATLNFTVDASAVSAPTVSNYFDNVDFYTGSFGSGTLTNDTRPTLNGSTPAGTTVEVFIDGASVGTATTSSGTWSFTPATDLSNGTHTVYVVATNSANTSTPSTIFSFSIDASTPNSPTVNTIETNDIINTAEKADGVTISGTAEANSIVKLYNNSVYLTQVTTNSSGIWSASFGSAQVPSDGIHNLSATATDAAGNTSIATLKVVTIDTIAPNQPTINTIEGNNIINAVEKADGVILNGTAEAGSSVAVTFGGITKTVIAVGGVWSTSYTPSEVPDDGVYNVSVVATDAAGNVSQTAIQSVIIDTQAPTGSNAPIITEITDDVGSIQGVVSLNAFTDDTTPTIKGTAEASSTIKIYDGLNLLGETTTDTNGQWTYTLTSPLDNATHNFKVTATDAAGNVSTDSNVYSVTIDTIAPSMTLSTTTTHDFTPAITGTISEPTANLSIFVGGVDVTSSINITGNTWSIPNDRYSFGLGSHTVIMNATDVAGNSSITTGTLTITDTAPIAIDDTGIISDEDVALIISTSQLLSNDTDADGDVLSIVSVQNAVNGTVALNNNGTITFIPSPDYFGPASFTYTTSDGVLGSTATVSLSINSVDDTTHIVIADMNGASAGDITLSESALSTGTNAISTGESVQGTFTVFDTDGLQSLTVGSVTIPNTATFPTADIAVANGLFRIDSFDGTTAHYTYTLTSPVNHNTNTSGLVAIDLAITDNTNVTVHKNLMVNVSDDAPILSPSTLSFAPSNINTNLMVTLDLSGSMLWESNGDTTPDSAPTRLALAKQALYNLIGQYDALGDVKVMLTVFSDGASSLSSWVSANEAKQIMAALEANGGTDYNDALIASMAAFGKPGKLTGSDVQNVSYFLSDGEPNNPITSTNETNWVSFLKTNAIVSNAIGNNTTSMNPIAYNGITHTDTTATIIASLNDLNATLAATVPLQPLVGNLSGSLVSTYGADGGYVKSFTADSITYSYTPTGNGTITLSGGTPSYYRFDDSTNTIVLMTSHGSTVTINMDTGYATFTAPAKVITAYSENFTFTTSDNDGDTTSSSANINVPATPAPVEINLIGNSSSNTLNGGASNDFLQGEAGNDTLNGAAGDDILVGNGGNDNLYGGDGNDTLISDIDTHTETTGFWPFQSTNMTYSGDTASHALDGGAGIDTLILSQGTNIDFTAFNTSNMALNDIEIINLHHNGAHELRNLSLEDVLAITDSNHTLTILGDSSDKVDFDGGNGWSKSGTSTGTINGASHTFDHYHNSGDLTVLVKVETAIADTI